MVGRQALRDAKTLLTNAGVENAAYDAGELFYEVTGRRALLAEETELSAAQEKRFFELVRRRTGHEPLQYICGSWGFYDIELSVGPGVLIPRQDTETVVEQALALIEQTPAPRVLDLCAGTGAIGCVIAHRRPDASVTCVEISPDAIGYLHKNAARWGAFAVQADANAWWRTQPANSADLITANPPYVTEQEYRLLAPELSFEPKLALVAGEDGLDFYRSLSAGYFGVLKPGGALCVEIGASQREAVCSIFSQNGYTDISTKQDPGGLDRCVFGRKGQ